MTEKEGELVRHRVPEDQNKNHWNLQLLDGGYLIVALIFNTFTAVVVKLTQNPEGNYDYNKSCVYLFAELLKLGFSALYCGVLYFKYPMQRSQLSFTQRDFLQYSIPGFVFFAQNNLSFVALQHLSSSAFQLLLNMRIMAVAVLSVLFLRKHQNQVEWCAIVLLTTGAAVHQLSSCSTGNLKTSSEGLFVMFLIILCASGGNVVTQKVMQKSMNQPLMLQNAILYLWGVAFNFINWMYSMDGNSPLVGDLNSKTIGLIIFNALYGLSISVILKKFGAITRTLISTAAIVFAAIVDASVFGERITVMESMAFIIILSSVYLHSVLGPQHPSAPQK